jgi:mono/diheme cytochrome c family protein
MFIRLALASAVAAAWPAEAWSQEKKPGPRVDATQYEGWRQYSAQCARCHGQDVVGNPVAANLLKTVASGGSTASPEAFTAMVREGSPDRGMPGFGKTLTGDQIAAVYAYVKGRADGKIAAGRPEQPK